MTESERRLRGISLMIVAVGIFAVMDALMKHLAASYPPFQVACLRGASSLPFVLATCLATGRLGDLRTARLPLHGLRAVISVRRNVSVRDVASMDASCVSASLARSCK